MNLEGDDLLITWGEYELRVDLSRVSEICDVAPSSRDELFSRWLVDDWQSLSKSENSLLEKLFSVAEININNSAGRYPATISGADILDMLREFKSK